MSRGERRALVVLAGLVAAMLVLLGVVRIASYLDAQQNRSQHGAASTMGEPVRLDSLEDARTAAAQAAQAAQADPAGAIAAFCYDGALEVTVQEARLYRDPSQARIDASPWLFYSRLFDDREYDDTDYELLLVTLHIENIDARPTDVSDEGHRWFVLSGVVNLSSEPRDSASYEAVYFDGTPAGASEHERTTFDLEPGASATYTVGYAVSQRAAEGKLYIYGGIRDRSKYHIDLSVEDCR